MPAEIEWDVVAKVTTRRVDSDLEISALLNQFGISNIDIVGVA